MPAATASRQGQAVADLVGGQSIDWDGNEIEEYRGYDDYLNSRPPREHLRRYETPRVYWEVRYPGCTLQPFPQMPPIRSLEEGTWICQNKAYEDAVREHIQIEMKRDPDDFLLTDDDMKRMAARKQDDIRYCKTCAFMTCNQEMANLHERVTSHETRNTPRVPYGALPEEG